MGETDYTIIIVIIIIIALLLILYKIFSSDQKTHVHRADNNQRVNNAQEQIKFEPHDHISTLSILDNYVEFGYDELVSTEAISKYPYMSKEMYLNARNKLDYCQDNITNNEWKSMFFFALIYEAGSSTVSLKELFSLISNMRTGYLSPMIETNLQNEVYYDCLLQQLDMFFAIIKSEEFISTPQINHRYNRTKYLNEEQCHSILNKLYIQQQDLISKNEWRVVRTCCIAAEDWFVLTKCDAIAYIIRESYRSWIVPNGGIPVNVDAPL